MAKQWLEYKVQNTNIGSHTSHKANPPNDDRKIFNDRKKMTNKNANIYFTLFF